MTESDLRQTVVQGARICATLGLNEGTAGNISTRCGDGFLVTPSGRAPEDMLPEDIVALSLDGTHLAGQLEPSSEWRFHRDIYRARPDCGSIVHTHSTYATALACTRRSIPAFHYMVAIAGGDSIRCAEYATFGTQELSDRALQALVERSACLLANHGLIALGADLDAALRRARGVENLARQYCLSLAIGGAVVLDAEEMRRVLERFEVYGQARAARPG